MNASSPQVLTMPPHRTAQARAVVPVAGMQGTLALDLQPRHEPPAVGPLPDVVRIDRGVRERVEDWSRRYTQAAVEIVGGDRPA